MKKRLLIFLIFSSFIFKGIADEGMWIPLLLKQLNEADMQSKGLKLSAEDIYSINKSSLKDAVVQFGGGCTAEIISKEGLLLTNHHCGFSTLQSHSSVQNDYITKGFWAKDNSQELPCKGLTVTFIIRMEDVTAKAMAGITANMNTKTKDSLFRVNYASITKEAIAGTDYTAFVRPFYYGMEHYLFITEVFKDIRLVGSPPSSIGKFGGDADNWLWPRHTGDFMVFRIYANKENKPAEYSTENVRYKPRHSFPVSLKGINENDFTMVYGFPGSTSEYISSYGVDLIQNVSDPAKIKLRDTALDIIRKGMKENDTVRIQYASKHDRISNYHKKWMGEIIGLKKNNTIERKKQQEKDLMARLEAMPSASSEYKSLFASMQVAYSKLKPYQLANDYYSEVKQTIEIIRFCGGFESLIKLSTEKTIQQEALTKELKAASERTKGFFKNYNASVDKKLCAALLRLYGEAFKEDELPDIFKTIRNKYKNNYEAYAKNLFEKSIFASEKKMNAFLASYKASGLKKIINDPAYILSSSINTHFYQKIEKEYSALKDQIYELNKTYMKVQREILKEKKFYPDANSTLRLAYGKVSGYDPKDGIHYRWYTTMDGLMSKEDSADQEFIVPEKLKELYKTKDYGQYADKNGKLQVNFIATNHSTGGNSGSPVLDGEGYLIGLNFDRNWEGCMADIDYDPTQVRNICVDIRYVLFVIDKFAGAGYLLNEMNLVK